MRIAVIADSDSALGFALSGVRHVFSADTPAAARKYLQWVRDSPGIGLVILTDNVADMIEEELKEWKREKGPYPVVIQVPPRVPRGERKDPIREMVRRALGVDIMK